MFIICQALLYFTCTTIVFLYSFTAEEAKVQSKFWYMYRMKYCRVITTFDVEKTFFRDTEKYNFILYF